MGYVLAAVLVWAASRVPLNSSHLTPQGPPRTQQTACPGVVGAPGDPAGDVIGKGQTRGRGHPGRAGGSGPKGTFLGLGAGSGQAGGECDPGKWPW